MYKITNNSCSLYCSITYSPLMKRFVIAQRCWLRTKCHQRHTVKIYFTLSMVTSVESLIYGFCNYHVCSTVNYLILGALQTELLTKALGRKYAMQLQQKAENNRCNCSNTPTTRVVDQQVLGRKYVYRNHYDRNW